MKTRKFILVEWPYNQVFEDNNTEMYYDPNENVWFVPEDDFIRISKTKDYQQL